MGANGRLCAGSDMDGRDDERHASGNAVTRGDTVNVAAHRDVDDMHRTRAPKLGGARADEIGDSLAALQ